MSNYDAQQAVYREHPDAEKRNALKAAYTYREHLDTARAAKRVGRSYKPGTRCSRCSETGHCRPYCPFIGPFAPSPYFARLYRYETP